MDELIDEDCGIDCLLWVTPRRLDKLKYGRWLGDAGMDACSSNTILIVFEDIQSSWM